MFTLGLVITRLRLKAMSLICTARELVIKKLSQLLGVLATVKIQLVTFLILPLNQVAQTLSNIKALLASPTIQASSIKQEPDTAKPEPTPIGQQPVQTVRKTRRRAKPASKKGM